MTGARRLAALLVVGLLPAACGDVVVERELARDLTGGWSGQTYCLDRPDD